MHRILLVTPLPGAVPSEFMHRILLVTPLQARCLPGATILACALCSLLNTPGSAAAARPGASAARDQPRGRRRGGRRRGLSLHRRRAARHLGAIALRHRVPRRGAGGAAAAPRGGGRGYLRRPARWRCRRDAGGRGWYAANAGRKQPPERCAERARHARRGGRLSRARWGGRGGASTYLPLTTNYLLLTTYYLPPTTDHLLLATHYLPPATDHLLLNTHCSLRTAYHRLPTT